MEKQLILISHGHLCEGLKESVEMIMGPQKNIHTVALLPEEGMEQFQAKFEKVTKDLSDFIVLCDLMGGTPCNTVVKKILSGEDIDLYAGMNLPMVIEFVNSLLVGGEVQLVEKGRDNVVYVNEMMREGQREGEDE